MDRGPSHHPLSWLLVPASAILVGSALSLPHQAYTGLAVREGWVASVIPGGPADRAGLLAGDRIGRDPATSSPGLPGWPSLQPESPVVVRVERTGAQQRIWLVPEPLPAAERRLMSALLLVACGFLLLGGLVWNERRDRLTAMFLMLSLAFACLLAPVPRFDGPRLEAAYEMLYGAVSLFLPAVLIHFFALFPEPKLPTPRLAAGVQAGYGLAALLMVAEIVTTLLQAGNSQAARPAATVLQAAAALWFTGGLLAAVILFTRSVLRSDSEDARRRLRVALAGTVLGLGPLAGLIALHSVSPALEVPGERWAVALTLLVPLSFAWAIVVHRVFDIRFALRASAVALIVALGGIGALAIGEWLPSSWSTSSGGQDLASLAMAAVALGAGLGGAGRSWVHRLAGLHPPDSPGNLVTITEGLDEPGASARDLLERACRVVTARLKMDRCEAVEFANGGAGPRSGAPVWSTAEAPPDLEASLAGAILSHRGPVAADSDALAPSDRETLVHAGIQWVVPIAGGPAESVRAALLLGRRLAGPWLDRHEVEALERLARHLSVAIENASLRLAAKSHGALDRELEQAHAIQVHLLPRRAPVCPALDCAAATLSSEPVGGDYYDFVEHSSREFTLAVGDVAGKGVPAALLLAGVQARLRSQNLSAASPGALLHGLNQELVHLDQPEKFVGLLCARVEARRGHLMVANAGITPPLIRRGRGGFEELTEGGTVLGVSPQASYPDRRIELRAGDVVLIYTDGLTEARRGQTLFGIERVRDLLEVHAHRRAAQILEALLNAVGEFAEPPLDDLTVVVLKQLADPVRARAPGTLKFRRAAADTPN